MRVHALTLIELLVVVTVLGMLVSAVMLTPRGATDAALLDAARIQLEQALRAARMRAIMKHAYVQVLFGVGTSRYALTESSDVANQATWKSLERVAFERFSLDAENTVADPDGMWKLRITPNGACLPWSVTLRAGEAHMTLCCDGFSSQLALAPAGPLPALEANR